MGDLPSDIPHKPEQIYLDQNWAGWGDWLGTGTVAKQLRKYRPFEEAREWARGIELKSESGWREFVKTEAFPPDIPAAPHFVYRDDGWAGYSDWLRTEQPAGRKKRRS